MLKNWFRKRKTALPVQESIQIVNTMIEERFVQDGWKYIKSNRKIRKIVGDLAFEVNFSTSRYNQEGKMILIEYLACVNCKKYKIPNKNILVYSYEPLDPKLLAANRYYDITYKENFNDVVEDICFQLSNSIVLLAKEFEEDFIAAGIRLSKEGLRYTYDSIYNNDSHNGYISIPFIDDYIGHEYAIAMAKKYYHNYLTQEQKELLLIKKEVYKNDFLDDKAGNRNEIYVMRYFDEIFTE